MMLNVRHHDIKPSTSLDPKMADLAPEGEPTVVPRAFNLLSKKPAAVPAYTRRSNVVTSNGSTFETAGTYIELTFPTGRGSSFLDPHMSYLEFTLTVKVTGAGGAANGSFNGFAGAAGAHALFSEMRVLVNGAPIEEILNYNLLAEIIYDQVNGGSHPFFDAQAAGAAVPAAATAAATVGGVYSPFTAVAGDRTANTVTTVVSSMRICIPLFSGVLGTLAEKAWPLFMLAPGSMQLQLRLAPPATAIQMDASTGAAAAEYVPSYSITDVQYVMKEILVHSSVIDAISSAGASGLSMFTQSFHNYTASVSGTGSSTIIPARLLGANSIFHAFRTTGDITKASAYSLRRVRPAALTGYQLVIGSERVPQKAISGDTTSAGFGEFLMELKKACHELTDRDCGFSPSFFVNKATSTTFGDVGYNALTSSINSSFLIGYDLDTYSLSNDTARSGRNLSGDTVTMELTASGPMTATTLTCDTFILHDQRVVFSPGGVVRAVW